jgi:Phage integrase family
MSTSEQRAWGGVAVVQARDRSHGLGGGRERSSARCGDEEQETPGTSAYGHAARSRRPPLGSSEPECPFVFHQEGRRVVRFDAVWDAGCEAVGLPGLLFHDLRRSGARNYRRAGVDEDVIQRIGGWKTASMFKRYNVVNECDLAEAGARLSAFLEKASSAAPTVMPLKGARATRVSGRTRTEHGHSIR